MKKRIASLTGCALLFLCAVAIAGPGGMVRVMGSGYTLAEATGHAYDNAAATCTARGSYVDNFEVVSTSHGAQWVVQAIAFCA